MVCSQLLLLKLKVLDADCARESKENCEFACEGEEIAKKRSYQLTQLSLQVLASVYLHGLEERVHVMQQTHGDLALVLVRVQLVLLSVLVQRVVLLLRHRRCAERLIAALRRLWLAVVAAQCHRVPPQVALSIVIEADEGLGPVGHRDRERHVRVAVMHAGRVQAVRERAAARAVRQRARLLHRPERLRNGVNSQLFSEKIRTFVSLSAIGFPSLTS